MNQDITSKEIENFFKNCRVEDIHQKLNNVEWKEMDNIYKRGSRLIDIIAVSPGLIEVVEGCVLLEINNIVISDHRSYIIDLNLQRYFDKTFSEWDAINKSTLNPSRRLHREKFIEILDDQLQIF